MITIQILTRNNEKTIAKTLKSILPLEAKIIVGDLGSSDSTTDICREYGAEVQKIVWNWDYSEARNTLLASGQNLMIEPWEILAKGHEEILQTEENSNILIVRGSNASRELRLWNGLKFKNPVYEVLEDERAGFLEEVAIVASGWPDRRKEVADICSKWRETRPTSMEPWYYSAFSHMALGNKKSFLHCAEKYLAISGKFGPAEVQISYKMAQVLASEGQFGKAAGLAGRCLAKHPTFAEFWCLFGDLFLKQKKYDKARSMYLNAMIIGSRRAANDSHPVEIDKYNKYPDRMIRALDEIDENTGTIISQKP